MDGGYPEVDKWFQQGIKWIIYVLQKESKGRKSGVFGGATPSKHLKNVLGRRRLYLDICVIGVEASSAHSNQAYVPIYRVYQHPNKLVGFWSKNIPCVNNIHGNMARRADLKIFN